MSVTFVDLQTAKQSEGLCLVLLKGVPSPWSQAAKAFVELKGIDALCVWMAAGDTEIPAWTGMPNGPVAMYNGEPPRSHWADILALSERLAPEPSLLPVDLEPRVTMFGLANEVMGQGGLIWNVRLLSVEYALTGAPTAYPEAVGRYLGSRYGHEPGCADAARARAIEVLQALASQLQRGLDAGGPYYFGRQLSALDVYSAVTLDTLAPLPDEDCPLHPKLRAGFEGPARALAEAIPPSLIAHRDHMHRHHLPLPIVMG